MFQLPLTGDFQPMALDCGVTLTVIVCWAALLPKLSVALMVMLSAAVEASVSVRRPRSVVIWLSVPLIDSEVVPEP